MMTPKMEHSFLEICLYSIIAYTPTKLARSWYITHRLQDAIEMNCILILESNISIKYLSEYILLHVTVQVYYVLFILKLYSEGMLFSSNRNGN